MSKVVTTESLGIKGKIFCVSMQRSGTSSVGDFLEQYGLRRAGCPLSTKRGWTRLWFEGNFEAIFSDEEFINHDVFEDDPWWTPEFYKYLYHRFSGSKFILLDRDSDGWFKSMIRHSYGFSLGNTQIHAKLYRREDELDWLHKNITNFGKQRNREMVVYDKAAHYKAVYERHNREVREFFAAKAPKNFFTTQLNDKNLWKNLEKWLGLPSLGFAEKGSHSHKAKGDFLQEHLLKQ